MGPQAEMRELASATEPPGRADQGDDVGTEPEALDLGRRADRVGQPRRAVRRLGGVLGHVGGDGGGVVRTGGLEDPDVDLGAPAGPGDSVAAGTGRHGDVGAGDGLSDGSGEHAGIEPGRRGIGRTLGSVGPEHDVEVDETPALELDHLHVGEPGDRPQLRRR